LSKKLSFALGIHNHQPLGNFPHVFRQAAEKAYRPFLEILWEYPEIPVTLHYTGVVLEWIQTNDPSMIELIKRMVQRGQIELLTGGYYEPILPMIADRDKIGQIRKLTLTLQQLFGYDPSGMWLAERIWEPQLTKPIAEAGVKYIIVDDSHFKLAGVPQNQLYGYYTIGEQGLSLAVFPISEKLRYDIPFKPAEEVVDYLLSVASSGEERLLVMADDGEKFGVWPGTYQWVYERRWLRRFFDELRNHRETIECVKLSDYLSNHVPLGPVYLPTAANPEMMKWALSATQRNDLTNLMNQDETEEYRPYLQGGFWRQFLSKYRESDNMTKKMLYVGSRIEQLPKSHRQEPLEILWGGQCNCGYWHGVFGGLYLNHLRTAVYRSFLEAEK
jgi:alpha-amylase